MTDPEITDFLVGVRQCQTVCLHGVREESGIEIQLDIVCGGKVEPCVEMLRLDLIARDRCVGNGIDGMQIDALGTGNERKHLLKVSHQLGGTACLAGIVAGRLNTAGQCALRLKACDIVALPAVDRNGDTAAQLNGGLRVHTHLRVACFCVFEIGHIRKPPTGGSVCLRPFF